MESIVTNLAKAAALRATEGGIYLLECSLGSVLECAACLDVAFRRHIAERSSCREAKLLLQQIARMEVGLRNSWGMGAKEEPETYGPNPEHYFQHESLHVYQRSLQVHDSLAPLCELGRKRDRYAVRVDQLSTSLTINIAEGNGRFSNLDHSKFLSIAQDAGTKLAAYLDLAAATSSVEVEDAKSNLREVMAMLHGLRGYLAVPEDGDGPE